MNHTNEYMACLEKSVLKFHKIAMSSCWENCDEKLYKGSRLKIFKFII